MNSTRGVVLSVTVIVSFAVARQGKAQNSPAWSYEGATGPSHWGSLSRDFAECSAGTEQSPIDIRHPGVADMPMIQFHYAPSSLSIANTGHTVKTYYDKGNYIEVAGKRYYLIEFHFHTPAEEAIDGKRADMDMHLVHQSSDGKFAVVGVMFRAGRTTRA